VVTGDERMTNANGEFGLYLRSLREKRDLGVNQLAAKAKISNAEVSRIESGERKRPHPDTLIKIANALRHPVADFYVRLGYLPTLAGIVDSPIVTRIKSLAESLGVTYDDVLSQAHVTDEQLQSVDEGAPDPHILWPVAQVLGTSMAYLVGDTDRTKTIIGRGQAAHDQSRLYRPADDIDPEDAWDLERAWLEVRRQREEEKKNKS